MIKNMFIEATNNVHDNWVEGLCHLGAKRAYKHKIMSNSQDEQKDTVYEDINKLKGEVDEMQNTIEILMIIRDQEESLKSLQQTHSRNTSLGCFKQIFKRTN